MTLMHKSRAGNDGRSVLRAKIGRPHPLSPLCLRQAEEGREQLHALGLVSGREGAASVGARFYLTDASQAGKPEEVLRCGSVLSRHSRRVCQQNMLYQVDLCVTILSKMDILHW